MATNAKYFEFGRRSFLKGAAALAATQRFPESKGQGRTHPNIVLFMVDQLSAAWVWETKAVELPNFQRLRAHGVSFDNTCVSNPVCVPSRASLATGLRTRGHGVLQNGYELDPAMTTYAQELQRGGWQTAAFGKLHHRPQFSGVHQDYRSYGFDVVQNTEDARAGFWFDWVAREHPDFRRQALATVGDYMIPELKQYGPEKINLSAEIVSIRSSFPWATPAFPLNNPGRYTLPFPDYLSQTEWITRQAAEYLSSADRSRPLYAQISYIQPHSPSCPPADRMKNVDESLISAPAPIEWLDDPLHPRCFPHTEGAHTVLPENWRSVRHYYMADLTHLDAQLGVLMNTLEATGRLKDTYIIFLSDHGELFLDHGFTGKGERHYDSCVRVPLVIAGPTLQRGKAFNNLVQLEDIFPTVMEMASLPMPEPDFAGTFLAKNPRIAEEVYPGRSLLPLCRGERVDNWRDAVEIESYNNIDSTTPDFWARTIRTQDWRYTLYPGGSGEQLFHLSDDPAEQHNLAGDPGYRTQRTAMRDQLLEKLLLQDYPHKPGERYQLGVF